MALDPTIVNLNKPVAQARAGSKSDDWRGGNLPTPNGNVQTKGAVPVKVHPVAQGNQGMNDSHTQPGKIKPVGNDAASKPE